MTNATGSVPTPREVAERYLEKVGAFWGAPDAPESNEAIVDLFAETVDWYVPGDPALLPWSGARRTREDMRTFYPALARGIEPRRYEVKRILADDEMAVVIGDLASAIRATGTLAESPFAIELGVRDGKIVRYRMHEDSYAVARAAGAL